MSRLKDLRKYINKEINKLLVKEKEQARRDKIMEELEI